MKNLILILTLLVFNFNAQAQDDIEGQTKTAKAVAAGAITIAPVLGGTSMDISGAKRNISGTSGATSSKSGSVFGVLGAYKIDWMDSTLESGLLYMETGTSTSNLFYGIDTTISYLAIPVNIRVPLGETAGYPWHAKAGLVAAFLTGAKKEETGLFASQESNDIKNEFNSFDLMLNLGVGGAYQINEKFQVLTDLAYLRGLTEVAKDGGGYNQGLSLSVALAISI